MNRTQDALSFFEQGYNCAQAIVAAFAPKRGASKEVSLRVASAFGAGMARTGDTCGVVSGALMAIGLHFGPSQKSNPTAKLKVDRTSKKFLMEFEKRHGTIICNRLRNYPDAGSYHKGNNDRCPGFVQTASEILEKLL